MPMELRKECVHAYDYDRGMEKQYPVQYVKRNHDVIFVIGSDFDDCMRCVKNATVTPRAAYIKNGTTNWWPGYHGHETLIIPAFDQNILYEFDPLRAMLGEPMLIPMEFGNLFAAWTRVFVVMNKPLEGDPFAGCSNLNIRTFNINKLCDRIQFNVQMRSEMNKYPAATLFYTVTWEFTNP
jgi:hypothetical protein